MINTLYLPELREMLANRDQDQLKDFCEALHPSRTADFMSGLDSGEAWRVIYPADIDTKTDIFSYFDLDRQLEILTYQPHDQVAEVITNLPADDRVDLLKQLDSDVVDQLLSRVPLEDRRDILRLRQYPEGTAGAMMTTDVVRLNQNSTVREALNELADENNETETVYYLYVVDEDNYLRGVVSARGLLSAMKNPEQHVREIMETDLIACRVMDDQEKVAEKVARIDLLAIPIVSEQGHLLGIVTHDDVIDVVLEEAAEDAQQMAAVQPLEDSYMRTGIFQLAWKRGFWLAILFVCSLTTAIALQQFNTEILSWMWIFVPLVISSGGNSGSQSATLVITAMSRGELDPKQWRTVVLREFLTGVLLGIGLATIGLVVMLMFPSVTSAGQMAKFVVPMTLIFIVLSATFTGSVLPMIFQKMGLDPAMMSNPLVAGIMDVLGIVLYVKVAALLMGLS